MIQVWIAILLMFWLMGHICRSIDKLIDEVKRLNDRR